MLKRRVCSLGGAVPDGDFDPTLRLSTRRLIRQVGQRFAVNLTGEREHRAFRGADHTAQLQA